MDNYLLDQVPGARDAIARLPEHRYSIIQHSTKPVEANGILAHHNTFPGQRAMVRTHVQMLAEIMSANGYWRPAETIDFAVCEDVVVLVNGQHRLSAQQTAGCSVVWLFRFLHAPNEDHVKRLYATFDTVHKMRSLGTVIAASPDLATVGKYTASFSQFVYQGLGYICKARGASPIYATIVKLWNDSLESISTLNAAYESGRHETRHEIRSAMLFGVMLHALRVDGDTGFWTDFFGVRGNGWAKEVMLYLLSARTRAVKQSGAHLTPSLKAAILLDAYKRAREGKTLTGEYRPSRFGLRKGAEVKYEGVTIRI